MGVRLGNINLYVHDVAASVRFYVDTLDLEHDAERSHPPGFALLRSDAMMLTLQSADAPGSVLGQSGSVELGFASDDPAATRERLKAAGAEVSELQTMGWGGGFDAKDPDGFRLSVYKMNGRDGG